MSGAFLFLRSFSKREKKNKGINGLSVLDVIGRQTSDMFLKHYIVGVFFFLSESRSLPKILLFAIRILFK